MNIASLLKEASDAGVYLFVKDNNLGFKLSVAVFPPEIKQAIINNKSEIIAFLSQRNTTTAAPQLPEIYRFERNGGQLPLSSAQLRLWFIDHLQGPSAQYNMPVALQVKARGTKDRFDVVVAEQAISRIIERHEPLRTSFSLCKDTQQPQQVIRQDVDFTLEYHDLSQLEQATRQTRCAQMCRQDSARPFDLSKDLMVRANYLKLDDKQGILLFNMHHIASDGWSMGLLVKEFIGQYQACLKGEPSPLQPLAIRYADYAQWQEQWLAGEAMQKQLSYWGKQLAQLPTVHGLPLDHPRPKVQQALGRVYNGQLDKGIAEQLEQLATSQQITLFMLMHGALALLLSRHSNSDDIVIGTPVANRTQPELEELIGLFVNTLVLRADTGHHNLTDYLQHIRQVNLEAQANQHVQFEQLVEHCKAPRSTAFAPLFQILLSMNTVESAELILPGLSFVSYSDNNNEDVAVKCDIELRIATTNSGIELSWVYDKALFSHQHIGQLNDHLQRLLTAMVQVPKVALKDLPMLAPVEATQLQHCLSNPPANNSNPELIHQLFEAQAAQSPDKMALVYQQQQLSYLALNQAANRLAHHLKTQGVVADTLVGLCVERGIELVVGLLAIIKAGGAYVPMDPNYPQARLQYMLTDTKLKHLLTQNGLTSSLELADDVQLTKLDDYDDSLYPSTNLEGLDKTHLSALAYVIYTSGSTGKPKGVMIEQQAFGHFLTGITDTFGERLSADSKVLAVTTMAFDIAGLEIWGALCNGAKLVVASSDDAVDPKRLADQLQQHDINFMQATPATWRLMQDVNWAGKQDLTILSGGEALPRQLADYLLPRCAVLYNCYGPTEATVWSLVQTVNSEEGPITLGGALPNYHHRILNQHHQLVPQGVIGELYIGGDSLARGYLNLPQLTNETFIADPLSDDPAARIYRTGDLVKMLADGSLVFIGRSDGQVKVQGFRIELAEIEVQLATCEGVASAVVLVTDERLVAYVVADSQGIEEISGLRSALKQRLPNHMIPSSFVLLDQWPLTANGKIDKKALPSADNQAVVADVVTADTDTERQLADIWAKLLKLNIDTLSVTASFFELGGHSLLAVRLTGLIRDHFKQELPVKVIFDSPSIRELALQIDSGNNSILRTVVTAIKRDTDTLPLSFAQQRLWFIDHLSGGSPEYNMPLAMRIEGDFDVVAAEQAINRIVSRHESLRTVFVKQQDEPVQLIRDKVEFVLGYHDLSDLSAAEQQLEMTEQVRADSIKAFDLSKDLMVRASVLNLSDRTSILLFNMHHIASDGWSMVLLMNEFIEQYQSVIAGEPSALAPLPIQYADYALWQRDYLQGEVMQTQLDYWQQQLEEVPPVHSLPLDHTRPLIKTAQGGVVFGQVSAQVSKQLNALAQQQGVTPFMVLHGAFSLLLARHGNNPDVVIGTPIANRLQQELAPLIGFFANTLVLRSNSEGFDTFIDYLEQIRQINLEAQAHQDIPFESLVKQLQLPRSSAFTPLLQIMLNMNTNDDQVLNLPGLTISPLDGAEVIAKFDLELVVKHSDEGIGLSWIYDKAIFDHRTIVRLNNHLQRLLASIGETPEALMAQLPMLSAQESRHLLDGLNDNQMNINTLLIHQWFETQAAKVPNVTAVEFADSVYSYQQINQAANRLAHCLRSSGVNTDTLVGVCLTRSPQLMIAVLAILKAGGAYVPLDPNTPQARLNYILADTGLKLLLSESKIVSGLSLPDDINAIILDDSDFEQWLADYPNQTPPMNPLQTSDSLAYVIYTSGTTGVPKGVLQTHQTVSNLVQSTAVRDGISKPLRSLQFTPSTFDVFVQELATCWFTGGTLVLISQNEKDDLDGLPTLLQNKTIERLFMPPAVLQLLAEQMASDKRVLTDLCEVIVAGEALNLTEVIRQFLQRHDHCQLWNHYGPTETHVVTTQQVTINDDALPPIGRAIANTQLYVLDGRLQPVPLGCVGKLYVGGLGLARGYQHLPEQSAQTFIDNPFISGERLYCTGDLVRYLRGGELAFIGRADGQVQIRGFRIELAEIEHQLANCAGVLSALVVVLDGRLVAYINSETTFDEPALKAQLGLHLPEYMLPLYYVNIDEWPLTVNGKVDRKALPAPDTKLLQGNYIAPATATEHTLTLIWAKLLKLDADNISVTGNFFELGGHSLLAVRLVGDIRSQLAQEIPVRSIFDTANLQALAAQIDAGSCLKLRSVVTATKRVSDTLPLSFAQQRLWFIDHLAGGSAEYNMPTAMQVTGRFDLAAAEQAIRRIVQRHESLRTVFIETDEGPAQWIRDNIDFALKHHDLSALAASKQQHQVSELVYQDTVKPFDLSADLMVRATVLTLSADSSVLLFNMHHIASDGWSLGILVNEFVTQYQSVLAGEPSPLAPLNIQYADYALWQRDHLQGEVLQAQLDYWQQQLADVQTVHSLPLDHTRPAVKTYHGAVVTSLVATEVSQGMATLAQQQSVTLFMLLHGALGLLLSAHGNNPDVVVGTPVANRLQQELTPLIGFFVNTLALRSNCEGYQSFNDYLVHIRQVNLDAQAHQDIQFESVVEHLQLPRSRAHSPLFQIMLSMNSNESADLSLPGVTFAPLIKQTKASVPAKFDLELMVVKTDDGLQLSWIYDKALFNHGTIARLDAHLQRLLAGIVASPQAPMTELPMLSAQETTYLVDRLNDTQSDHGKGLLIHQLFEAHAKDSATAIALEFGDIQYTYQQLNQSANRLANYLNALGVTTDTLVGICVNRSPEMIMAILAVLKAGGAYVQIDAHSPRARRDYILKDTGLKLLLTQSVLVADLNAPNDIGSIVLDNSSYQQMIKSFSADNRPTSQPSNSLAYVIYTSGTTCLPKGVLQTHQTVTNLVYSMADQDEITTPKRTLQFSANTFDAFIHELGACWLTGSTLVLISQAQKDNLNHLPQLLKQQRIGRLFMPPAVLQLMAEQMADTQMLLPDLAEMVVAGEALHITPAIRDWLARHVECRLFNHYGPTETHVVTTQQVRVDDKGSLPPIGRAVANSRLYVLDSRQQLVPFGAVGELYVGGDCLARGYQGLPEMTAEKFINSPFGDERLYCTGDLVRYLPDGALAFIGRSDDQVKIRGFRIELAEVEYQLAACRQVAACVVMAREDVPGQKRLVGYLVVEKAIAEKVGAQKGNTKNDELIESIRQQLIPRLPDYMLPSAFIVLDNWPLTVNGKIDKRALPAPDITLSQGDYCTAQTATEQALLPLWAKLLKLKAQDISTTSNFFKLGGHSLLAVQLITLIQRELKVTLPVKALFSHGSLKALAGFIDAIADKGGVEPAFGITPLVNDSALPPLFVAPALGMMAIGYQGLASSLADRFNTMILTTPGIDEPVASDCDLLTTGLSQRVETWYQQIKAIQPSGHYRLMGHSFGGDIAFELAYKLEQAGNSAEVVLLDSVLAAELIQQEQLTLADLLLPVDVVKSLTAGDEEITDEVLYQQLAGLGLLAADKTSFGVYCQAAHQQMALFRGYQPSGTLAGKVTLMQASAGLAISPRRLEVIEQIRHWCQQPLGIATAEGEHLSMVQGADLFGRLRGLLADGVTLHLNPL